MHDILSSEIDADMLYHERMGTELTHQVWNLNDEDIETDFPTITGQLPSVNVNPTQELRESMNSIIRWILLFLCSSFCAISDNAREILLEFLGAVFDSLATVIAASFPKSLHLLKKKQFEIDQDEFMKLCVQSVALCTTLMTVITLHIASQEESFC